MVSPPKQSSVGELNVFRAPAEPTPGTLNTCYGWHLEGGAFGAFRQPPAECTTVRQESKWT